MLTSIVIKQSKIEVEVTPENITFPIKVYKDDITDSYSREEALRLGSLLLNAVQDFDIRTKSN